MMQSIAENTEIDAYRLGESLPLAESLLSTERQLCRTENRRHGHLGLITWEIAHMT